jgi:hypothetical protein
MLGTACFPYTHLELNSSEWLPPAVKATKLSLQVTQFDTNSENQLPQAAASNHSDVLVFMLHLSEGRSAEAWEPCNYIPPEIQSSTSTFRTKITKGIGRSKCNRLFGFVSLLIF